MLSAKVVIPYLVKVFSQIFCPMIFVQVQFRPFSWFGLLFSHIFTTLGCNEKIEKQLFSENDFQSYKFCKRQNELPSADLDEEADQPVKSQKTCLRNYYKKNLEKVKGLIIQGYINGCEAYENRKDQVACFQFV